MKLTAGRARTLRDLLDRVSRGESGPVLESQAKEAIAYLKPRPKMRKVLPFASRKEVQEKRRLTRKEKVALVRPLVEKRAFGSCECGCGMPFGFDEDTAEWDEFYGRKHVSVGETWMLRRGCHWRKTHNYPSRLYWDERFAAHCRRHSIPFRKRFYKQPAERRIP